MTNEIQLQLSQQPKQINVLKQQKTASQENKSATAVSEEKGLNKAESDTVKADSLSADKLQQNKLSDLQEKVSQLNDHIQNLNRNIEFSVDERSGESIITVRDSKTKEVIRQIPSEELLDARRAVDKIKGNLIEVKA